MVIDPDFVEGKRFPLKDLSYYRWALLTYSVKKQQCMAGFFTASQVLKGSFLHCVSVKEEGLESYLISFYEKGVALPKIFFLDDLFFQAIKSARLPMGHSINQWVFLLRKKKSFYFLSCFHDNALVFKRTFDSSSCLMEEMTASQAYLKRFGYKNHQIQVFFFANQAEDFPIMENIIWKRVPYNQDDVIQAGLRSSQRLIFSLPHTPLLNKAWYFSLLKRVGAFVLAPLCGLSFFAFLSVHYAYHEGTFEKLRRDLEKAQELPKDYALFQQLEVRQKLLFDDVFWSKLSSFLKNRVLPESIDANFIENSVKLSFSSPLDLSSWTPLKKNFQDYRVTIMPRSIAFFNNQAKAR